MSVAVGLRDADVVSVVRVVITTLGACPPEVTRTAANVSAPDGATIAAGAKYADPGAPQTPADATPTPLNWLDIGGLPFCVEGSGAISQ